MPGRSPSIWPVRMIVIAMIGIIPAPAPIVRRPGIGRPVRPPARRTMTARRPATRRSARRMPPWWSARRFVPRRSSGRMPPWRMRRRRRSHNRRPPRLMPAGMLRPSRPRMLPAGPTRSTRPPGPGLRPRCRPLRRRPAILRPANNPGGNRHHKKQENPGAKTHG